MRTLKGHTRDARAVAYTADGRLVSGGGADKSLRVWDVATGECAAVVKAKGPVYAVATHPGGGMIAYAGRAAPRAESNFAYLCDPDGKPLGRYELRAQGHRWERNPATGQSALVPTPEARSIWSLAFSADGKHLAAACRRIGGGGIPDGGGGRCWALAPGAAEPEISLAQTAYSVAFAPAGARLAVTNYQRVTFHEKPGAAELVAYPLSAMWSPAVAFVPGADLAAVGANSFLYLVNPARREKPTRLKTDSRMIAAVAASPDGKTLVVGGRTGTVEVYDAATRTLRTTYDFGVGGLHALAFAPDGLTFAAAGDEGLAVCDAV